MRRPILFFSLCLLFLIASPALSQTHFTATLNGGQENPSVTTDATGTGTFVLTDAGLQFSITVEGLDFTAAHFHGGAIGVNGPVVRALTSDFEGNTATGIWTSSDTQPLTDSLVTELLNGNLYVNVHTAANTGGEIRGQVNLSSGTGFTASLGGDQENPPVTTDATGTGFFVLTDAGLVFNITVEGLDFTAAHFHNAAAGSNGGVVRTLSNDFEGSTAAGVWTSSDTEPLTNELISELMAGNLYVNVHTAANTGGEIRGQVMPITGTGFSANLNGDQENPAITSDGTGTGAFILTDNGLEFAITVEGLEFTAAHFHSAATGSNGGVVRTLTSDFDGNTASGIWTSSDTEPLTDDLITELLTGNLYVNVHTAANTGGEIRGQVKLSTGTGFSVSLNGRQQNPPIITDGTGTGACTLTDAGLIFNVTLEGLDFTAAHFHNAAVGDNGPVVRTITGDFDGNTAAGIWTDADSEPLTAELLAELMAGNLYINAHTAANLGGEIRGQVGSGAIITSVERIGETTNIPEDFVLSQNFPNPFNPTTEIRFDLNASGLTVLRIYNTRGQQVATLVNEILPAGSYKVTFAANELPSGVYIYELTYDKITESRRMLLLK